MMGRTGVPLAGDLLSALDAEFDESDEQLFGPVFDASKAHRRVPVASADWGYRPAHFVRIGLHQAPRDIIWLNTVGTYGWAAPPTGGPGRAH